MSSSFYGVLLPMYGRMNGLQTLGEREMRAGIREIRALTDLLARASQRFIRFNSFDGFNSHIRIPPLLYHRFSSWISHSMLGVLSYLRLFLCFYILKYKIIMYIRHSCVYAERWRRLLLNDVRLHRWSPLKNVQIFHQKKCLETFSSNNFPWNKYECL